MEELLKRIFQHINVAAALTLLFLGAALTSVVGGIATRVRDLDLTLILGVAWLAILAGWGLGSLRLRTWQSIGLALLGGVLLDLVWVGQLGGQLLNTLWQLGGYAWAILQGPRVRADFTVAGATLLDLLTRINTLLVRLRDWVIAISNSQPAFDPVAVALTWVLVGWLAAIWAGWWTKRGRPLLALSPALGALAIILAYSGGLTVYLLIPIGALLLLMVMSGQQMRESHWEGRQVDFSENIRFDLGLAGGLLSIGLVLLAGVVPSISIQAIADRIREASTRANVSSNPLPSSLGLQPAPVGNSAFEALRYPGLPRQHLIGSGPELSQHVVMYVSASNPALRYYWRNATYDQYTGHGWLTSATQNTNYRASVRLVTTALSDQRLVTLDIRPVEPLGGIVYTAGALVSVDADYTVAWRTDQDMFSATTDESYKVETLLADPNAAQLRSSPPVYPDPIRSRYLALPDSVPQRVLSLARDLTATAPTPYDRAKAIESYLRAYPYTLDLPAPPPGVDIVDYFLFTLKRGYCDYYASSMVVLARAAGLPARLVSGYASGAYDEQTRRYVVTEADAHSWPEIYFAGYGWVEFEPTGGRPPLERSGSPQPTLEATLVLPPNPDLSKPPTVAWFPIVWGLVTISVLGLAGWQLLDWVRLRRVSPAQTSRMLYHRLIGQAQRLATRFSVGDTPHEFAQALVEALARRQAPNWVQTKVKQLVELYVQTIYSPHRPGVREQQQAIQLWGDLRWDLWWRSWKWAGRFKRVK